MNNGRQINTRHYMMPLVASYNASCCCCVLGNLRSAVLQVYFPLLFHLWRPKLSFWRHVVRNSRALKRLNQTFFTLTGQREPNSYTSLDYVCSIPRWTELDLLSQRNSLFSISIAQNGFWISINVLSHVRSTCFTSSVLKFVLSDEHSCLCIK